jgi:hypothetical protein
MTRRLKRRLRRLRVSLVREREENKDYKTLDLPLCSFSASAIVSKPKCVVCGASWGDFGGGGGGGDCGWGRDCLREQEKHLYDARAVLALPPASNCRPSEACMVGNGYGNGRTDKIVLATQLSRCAMTRPKAGGGSLASARSHAPRRLDVYAHVHAFGRGNHLRRRLPPALPQTVDITTTLPIPPAIPPCSSLQNVFPLYFAEAAAPAAAEPPDSSQCLNQANKHAVAGLPVCCLDAHG